LWLVRGKGRLYIRRTLAFCKTRKPNCPIGVAAVNGNWNMCAAGCRGWTSMYGGKVEPNPRYRQHRRRFTNSPNGAEE